MTQLEISLARGPFGGSYWCFPSEELRMQLGNSQNNEEDGHIAFMLAAETSMTLLCSCALVIDASRQPIVHHACWSVRCYVLQWWLKYS